MNVMHAPIYFEKFEVHGDMKTIPTEVLDSSRRNKVCLKGRLNTPMGGGMSSLNVQLRKELDLYYTSLEGNMMKEMIDLEGDD
ncbi:putative isocitrate dehydrogenase (NAD(+)) [Helianthus annuus]|nr:putative isocitrate dehydrogenase (NAD(+)) [Helianthus annuus]